MQLNLGPNLAALKRAALLAIDEAAEACRQQFITPGAGQAMEYTGTEIEGREYFAQVAAGGTPNIAAYPMLAAELNAIASATGTAPTLEDIATLVVIQAEQWKAVGSLIKELRRAAKLRIEMATTPAQIRAARQISWPSPG